MCLKYFVLITEFLETEPQVFAYVPIIRLHQFTPLRFYAQNLRKLIPA
jgi:hypothetical protein